MTNGEFQQYFGHFGHEETQEVTDRWLALPILVRLPEVDVERAKVLVELQGSVEVFVEQHRKDIIPLVKEDRHFEALDLIDRRLAETEAMFSGNDLLTARIYTLRRRGYIQEHLATYGGYSQLELGHPFRTVSFLSAARDYMQADLELGCITDYALRVSECFGGARIGTLQRSALTKFFGGHENVTLISKDSTDLVILQDLIRRATKITPIAPVPGSIDAIHIQGELPDPQRN